MALYNKSEKEKKEKRERKKGSFFTRSWLTCLPFHSIDKHHHQCRVNCLCHKKLIATSITRQLVLQYRYKCGSTVQLRKTIKQLLMCSFHHSVVVSGNGNDSKALHNTSIVKWYKTSFSTTKKLNKKTEGTNNTKLYIWDGYDGHNCSMLCQVQLLPHFPPPLCFIHRPPHLCFIPICVLSVHSATLGLFHSCMPQHETEQSFQQLKIYHGHLVLTVKTPTLKTKKDNHNMFSFLFSVFTDSHLLVLTVVEWDDARCGYMINWWGENPNMFVRSVLKNVCILKIQFHNLLVYCYCPRWVLWWCLHSTMRVSLKTWQWHYWQSNIHYTPVVLWPSV